LLPTWTLIWRWHGPRFTPCPGRTTPRQQRHDLAEQQDRRGLIDRVNEREQPIPAVFERVAVLAVNTG
jgi:hypothetical protein